MPLPISFYSASMWLSLNPFNSSLKQGLWWSPSFRGGNWGTEKLSELSLVTQLVNSRDGFKPRQSCLQIPEMNFLACTNHSGQYVQQLLDPSHETFRKKAEKKLRTEHNLILWTVYMLSICPCTYYLVCSKHTVISSGDIRENTFHTQEELTL